MVGFNKGINIIKHNFLKLFCIVDHSGTVIHATGGRSFAHARNMPESMRDPKNYNFNAQHSIKFFYFIVIIVKQYAEKWYHLLYRYMESPDIAKKKMLRSDWLIHKFAYI